MSHCFRQVCLGNAQRSNLKPRAPEKIRQDEISLFRFGQLSLLHHNLLQITIYIQVVHTINGVCVGPIVGMSPPLQVHLPPTTSSHLLSCAPSYYSLPFSL